MRLSELGPVRDGWRERWQRLTSGDTLFQAVHQQLHAGAPEAAGRSGEDGLMMAWAEKWLTFLKGVGMLDQSRKLMEYPPLEARNLESSPDEILRATRELATGWLAFENPIKEKASRVCRESVLLSGTTPPRARAEDYTRAWEDFLEVVPDVEKQCEMLQAVAWCADEVTRWPDRTFTRMDMVTRAAGRELNLQRSPRFIQDRWAWAMACVRLFSLSQGAIFHQVRVPVALIDSRSKSGFIAFLLLEVVTEGTGQVIHHPAHPFSTSALPDFSQSIEDGWKAARQPAGKPDEEGSTTIPSGEEEELYDGYWRLIRSGDAANCETPVPCVDGNSAGGAAALGWWHALRKKVPDDRVIVAARLEFNRARGVYELCGFREDYMEAKARAVAEYGHFDTIVVASTNDKAVAERGLVLTNGGGRSDKVRVVLLA